MTLVKTAETIEKIEYEAMPRLKAYHPFIASSAFPRYVLNSLEVHANVNDVSLKKAPKYTLEGSANTFILASERAEQEAIRANPPKFCKGHVERSDFPLTSLYSDYVDRIEESLLLFTIRLEVFGLKAWTTAGDVLTWEDYRTERRKWRKCRYKFCLNYITSDKTNFKEYPTKRSDAIYCCDDCREDAHEADERFGETGSYLPIYYYLPRLSDSVGDDIRKYEYAAPSRKIEKQINKKRPQRRAVVRKEVPRSGEVVMFKTLADAQQAYAEADRTGWRKIS